jgi:hypothetical protein
VTDVHELTQKIIAVKNRHADSLMSLAGVVGHGVGFVRKGGERTDEIGVVVIVDKNCRLTNSIRAS